MSKPDAYYQNAAKEWFKRAKDDILWTENNISGGFYTQACFTSQQVVEKSLKAYLRSRRREIDNRFRTHQLTNLLYECIKFDQQFKNLEKDCRLLNEYYAPTRYPEILGLEFRGYEKDQAEEALKFAKEIYDFVEKRLK